MRMRKKKNADIRLEKCSDCFLSGDISSLKNINLEIGCGKGGFIVQLAASQPDKFFVCIEKMSDVILLAAEKIKNSNLKNVKFLRADASVLSEYFSPGSVDRIYLNFSDPWPRPKHAKRRLTSESYLDIYKNLLSENGAIFLKTDNRILFDYSLETFRNAGFRLEKLTYDLHNSEYESGNFHTEYENNFSGKGFAINRVEAYKN